MELMIAAILFLNDSFISAVDGCGVIASSLLLLFKIAVSGRVGRGGDGFTGSF